MTSDAATLLRTEPAETLGKRAFRRDFWEFLVVGGGSLVLLPGLFLYRRQAGLDDAEAWVGWAAFQAAMIINNPHFAVTYLLFYRDAKERAFGRSVANAQRARYWVAGLVVPLLLAAWVTSALADHSARQMGFLIQLMFFLVGWHYVKQGFGVVTVLSLRRGFRFDQSERRALLAHCFASWLYGRTNPHDPGRPAVVDDVLYTSLPHPHGLDTITRGAFALSAAFLAFTLWRRFRHSHKRPPLVPLLGFLITVWLWTAFSRLDPLFSYVIPALHSLQYLYFVWLSRRNQALAQSGPPAFRSVAGSVLALAASAIALGWSLFRALPTALDGYLVLWDAIDPLGTTPYLAGITAFVNIHHYAMDAVIWRREMPEARYLLDA